MLTRARHAYQPPCHTTRRLVMLTCLRSDPEVVRGKLLPKITELAAACKDLDVQVGACSDVCSGAQKSDT